MKNAFRTVLIGVVALGSHSAFAARGVSPYLPLHLAPDMERRIERVLILADKPVLTRPFAAATVLDALPKACNVDPVLCAEVRAYLAPYMRSWGLTEARAEVSTASGAEKTIPNEYGLTTASDWNASARGFWQPYDHALLSVGATAYQGEVIPDGTLLSVGWDFAQFDLGYRPHWFSPMTDSSMLSSTQAATMPSLTVSNYVPFTRFGFHYEGFIAAMSRSDRISFGGTDVSGRPRLAGIHLSMEPASGWALGVNRLLQYGGGPRPSSTKDLFKAFFNPSSYDNTNANLTSDQQFGNQVASVTSSLIFPGRTPFAVYFEYAGEDTSYGKNYLLGNSALSAGIHFPRLWKRFELTYEVSEWQNGWYVNNVYGDGLTNKGHVIGHWGGDERVTGNDVGAQTHMLNAGWNAPFGGLVELRLSTLENQHYFGTSYERAYDGTLRYSRALKEFTVGAEVYAGKDVFGDNFSRIGAFFSYSGDPRAPAYDALDEETTSRAADKDSYLFVEAGASSHSVDIDLTGMNDRTRETNVAPHFAVGARRAVSDRSDLGARLELDQVNSHSLVSVRALDYRYRFENPLALSVWLGASRYDLATPAYGLYMGIGLQWRDLLPGWDAGVELSNKKKVARDRVLPSDPTSTVFPDAFYTIQSIGLTVSKRF